MQELVVLVLELQIRPSQVPRQAVLLLVVLVVVLLGQLPRQAHRRRGGRACMALDRRR